MLRTSSNSRRALTAVLVTAVLALAGSSTASADPTAEVIGGTNVTHSEYVTTYSYMVGLLPNTNPLNQFCGGTLIAPTWVMTAAHCYAPAEGADPKYIVVGSETLAGGGETIPVTSHFIHPDWDPSGVHNDIMLLHLAYQPSIATPALRPTAGQDPPAGTFSTLIGWGLMAAGDGAPQATILQIASIDVIDQSLCQSEWYPVAIVTSNQLCAIHEHGQFDAARQACNGDSGGPLIYGGRVVGIVSYGVKGCYDQAPNVYTRVSAYGAWIDGVLAKVLNPQADSLSFGPADVTTGVVQRTISFRSEGVNPVTVLGANAGGDFAVTASTCVGSFPSTSSCSVVVEFNPSNNGVRTGVLVVNTDSIGYPTLRIPLDGNGTGRSSTPVALKLSLPRKSKVKSGKLTSVFKVGFAVPVGASQALACSGLVKLSMKVPKIKKAVFQTGAMIWTPKGCSATLTTRMSKKGKGKTAKATVKFAGNEAVGPATLTTKIKIR